MRWSAVPGAGTTPGFYSRQQFEYDSLDRLKKASETVQQFVQNAPWQQSWEQTFDYDRFGNRTQFAQTINGQSLAINNITRPQIDAGTNRYSEGQGYNYDNNGNLIKDAENKKYVFNADNKQVAVKTTDGAGNETGSLGTYFYDGEGKRVKKIDERNGEVTIFVYDAAGKLIAEYSTNPSSSATTSYTTSDHLGSPRIITDQSGNVVSRRDFLPFGEDAQLSGVPFRHPDQKFGALDSVRQRFTGYQKGAETQLDFAEARYYQNKHGRFTAVDPLLASGKSANPQTFNRYAYVLNNPLILTDPLGLQAGAYIGRVYTDGTKYSRNQFEGSYQFKGAQYVEAEDGFSYSVTTGGFYSIGKTADVNAVGARFADSQLRESAYANSMFPSAWIPELQIDPPGYEDVSQTGFSRFLAAEAQAEMRETDTQRAFGITMGVFGGLGGALGHSGAPPRFSSSSSSNASNSSSLMTVTHRGTPESIASKIESGVLPANYPNPNNAFTRFSDHSKPAVWVSEGQPTYFNYFASGVVGRRGQASITFQIEAGLVRPPNGIKRIFGPAQRVIEQDVTIPPNATVRGVKR